jgi:hypothetical protein
LLRRPPVIPGLQLLRLDVRAVATIRESNAP